MHQAIVFPYTYDLAQLITLVQTTGLLWPQELDEAAELTAYAVGSRYPGAYGNITTAEYAQAIDIAQRVIAWAERMIRGQAAT